MHIIHESTILPKMQQLIAFEKMNQHKYFKFEECGTPLLFLLFHSKCIFPIRFLF